MLTITVPESELWDPVNERFILTNEQILYLEHSLESVSKWEMKWHKPFLNEKEKTLEELYDYIYMMCLNDVERTVIDNLNSKQIETINNYINDPMTATWFRETNKPKGRDIITNEIIYYWMTELNIPFECEKWHLNRLMTLIRVCSIKKQPPKKMGKRNVAQSNSMINAARRKRLGSKG